MKSRDHAAKRTENRDGRRKSRQWNGPIFYKAALRGLKNNRTRTLVTVIGVMLSAALFTGVATFGTSLIAYMVRSEIAKGGNWHVMFSGVSAAQKQEWAGESQVADTVSYENIGYALLPGAEETSGGKPYVFLAGFSDEAFEKLPVRLVSGRKPENGSEVLVPADSIAAKAGVRISVKDTLALTVGEREGGGKSLTQCDPYTEGESLIHTKEQSYTVVGTFEKTGFEMPSSPGYTLITKAEGEEISDSYSLYIALKDPRQSQVYGESKKEVSAYGINEELLRFMGISSNKIFNAFLYTIGGVLALIIMAGSVLLIYNSFYISLNERVHQYGIFMSVGATAKQLRGMVLFEGVCIGCIGIPLGILLGIGCVVPFLPVVSRMFATQISYGETLTLAVSVRAVLFSALVSMVTILISAYIPARKAAAMPIMDCIRQNGEIKTGAEAVRIGRSAWKLYGLEGSLALKNFKRNKKRYRSVVFSLTLSIVLMVAGSAFGTSIKKVAGGHLGQEADGDVAFMTQDMTEEEFGRFYDRIKSMEDIQRSTWQADCFYAGETDEMPEDFLEEYRKASGEDAAAGNDQRQGGQVSERQKLTLYTQFIEDDIYCDFVEELGLPVEEYTGENGKVFICGVNSEEHTTYFAGETMHFTISSPSGSDAKEICATFEDTYPLDGAYILEKDAVYVFIVTAPLSMKPQFEGIETIDGCVHLGALFWTGMPTQIVREIQEYLVEEEVMADYELYNLSRAFEVFRSTGFVIDVFTVAFTVMISLIAVANVFNTISTNIRLRRRELAMLRSVGMSDKGFNRMMRFECAFYGMRTLLLGIPVSAGLSWLIHRGITSAEKVEDVAFSFPWGAMGISVLGVFCIVFVTMVYATGKIRKENIIDALKDEM